MNTAIRSLKAIRQAITSSQELRDIMNNGKDISKAVTTRPRMNLTSLNSETGMNSYVTISFNKVENYDSEAAYYLKIGVVTDAVDVEDPSELVLRMVDAINKIITKKELTLGFAEQFEFGEMEETYFDLDQLTWGYVIIYGNSDIPL